MMTSKDFVQRAEDIARCNKTLYVMGAFGAPLSVKNRARYADNNAYNRDPARRKKILAATDSTFAFDCCGLIKGILWGWAAMTGTSYGGASYTSNGVPDLDARGLINACPDASTTGWDKIEAGEVLWLDGHIGIYIGGGLCVESSPAWADGVQITAVSNLGTISGYHARKWTRHGHLPYIDYSKEEDTMSYEDFCAYMDRYLAERASTNRPSSWAVNDGTVAWAEYKGVISGDGHAKGYQALVTKEQVAAMIRRALK